MCKGARIDDPRFAGLLCSGEKCWQEQFRKKVVPQDIRSELHVVSVVRQLVEWTCHNAANNMN